MNEFLVKDLYFAAILVTEGLKIQDIHTKDKAFVFAFDAELAKPLERAYWARELQPTKNYKDFVDNIHDLKAQMRSLSLREDS
jgi:hypothetical protein